MRLGGGSPFSKFPIKVHDQVTTEKPKVESTSQQGKGILLPHPGPRPCIINKAISKHQLESKPNSLCRTWKKRWTLLLEIGALTRRDREPRPKGTKNTHGLHYQQHGALFTPPTYLQSLTPPFPRTQIRLPKTLLTRLTSKERQSLISLLPPLPLPHQSLPLRTG